MTESPERPITQDRARSGVVPTAVGCLVGALADAVQIILSDHHIWGGLQATHELGRLCETFGGCMLYVPTLRDLKRRKGSEITIFCSHDQRELEAMQARRPVRGRPFRPAPEAPSGSAEVLG